MADVKVIENIKYTTKHEWVKIEGDVAVCGISDYAQSSLGDLVFLDLFAKGNKVSKGETIGTIESVKAADDIYAPIGGEVVEVNESVMEDPALVIQDSYSNWMVKIKGFEQSEIDSLMNSAQYKELTLTLE